jgi:uncharacterized protein (TIGR02996 family)
MRTFVYQDAKSHKFWHINRAGTTLTLQYGRVGSAGQSQVKKFATEAAAQREADKLIAEKLKKGYTETTPPTGPGALRKALEDAILDNPEDIASHAAYADLLQEQGDPQGELVQVQLAMEDEKLPAKRRRELTKREAALLKEHGEQWIGEWAKLTEKCGPEGRGQVEFPGPVPCRFIRGVLAEVTFDAVSMDCATAFVKAPQTRLVRRLFIGGFAYEEDEDINDDDVFAELCRWPYYENLRVFQFGWTSDDVYGDFCDNQCHLDGEKVHELIRRMPRLEELYLFANPVQLEALFRMKTMTNLRVLQLYHNWDYPLGMLAANKAFSNLTHLLLHPKALGAWSNSDVYITSEGVRRILTAPHLQKLTHLRLRLTRLGDEGCEMIVRSGALKRLKLLDLRHGCIGDDGARTLAACPDLKNLELLDLSRNQLTETGIAALQATGVKLLHEFQHAPVVETEDSWPEFLMEGDYE